MAVVEGIADWAKGELPQEWEALLATYGDDFLTRKIDSIMMQLFAAILDEDAQLALDVRVLDYCGKLVALELINPGISYWSKQALSMGARGQNETKAYKDRAEDLRELRKELIAVTRTMYPEVAPLLPSRRITRIPIGPRVRQALGAVSSDPDLFERPFLLPEEVGEGGTAL